MKKYWLNFLFVFLYGSLAGQQRTIDSLKVLLPTNNDTINLVYNRLISLAYKQVNFDSAIIYAKNFLRLSEKLDYKLEQAEALREMAYYAAGTASGLELTDQAQKLVQQDDEKKILPAKYLDMLHIARSLQPYPKYRQHTNGFLIFMAGIQYFANKQNDKALPLFQQTLEVSRSLPDSELLVLSYLALGIINNNADSSIGYCEKSYQIAKNLTLVMEGRQIGNIEGWLAGKYADLHNYPKELLYINRALAHNIEDGAFKYSGWNYLHLANYYRKNNLRRDSVFLYGHKAFEVALEANELSLQYETSKLFFEIYKDEGNSDSAFKYLDIMLAAKEKTSNEEKVRKFEAANFNILMRQAAIEASNEKLRSKVQLYSLLAGLAVFILLAIIFWRNSKRRRKEFLLLQKQKLTTDQALQELKATQAQLIQSEKMASLGELTAGIAHEIQNPLNFVNNFSEVNKELLVELNDEIEKGNFEDVKAIAKNVIDNEEKINHHGKRADSIVKGMLQHSRTSTGQKEPTNINGLADEYLRLAYHGLRGKDKNFNATINTDFDENIGKINIIPQDIGRAILNLITNAFYAVEEKKKLSGNGYEPTVTVSTSRSSLSGRGAGGEVIIKVADNGNGIPQKLLDKIFQPFFSTKPTGQGTGLGLSLSYDIVKAHGGEIKVETKEREETTFTIILPVS